MNTKVILRIAAGLALLLYISGLFIGGAQPQAAGLIPAPWDKLGHLIAFGVLAVLLELALRPPTWLLFAMPLAVSAIDELHQMTLPGRFPSVEDWLAGALGVTLAWWLLRRTELQRKVALLHGV